MGKKKLIMIIVISVLIFIAAIFLGVKGYKEVRINNMTDFFVEANNITDDAEKNKLKEEIRINYKEISSAFGEVKKQYDQQQSLQANAKPAVPEVTVTENPVATINVEGYGTMTFELYANDAPQSVYNFIELANTGFYDGLTFHRLIKDFVVQGGDPDGTGAGGPGYSIKGEFPSNEIANPNKHDIGTLAMARSQENDSAGSQFYIVSGEQGKSLSNDYAAFGKLITGQEVLDTLNNAPVEGESPTPTISISSIKIDTKGTTFPSPEKLQ